MTEAERRRQARRGASGQNLRILGEATRNLKANDTRIIRGITQYYNPKTKKFQNSRYVAKAPEKTTAQEKNKKVRLADFEKKYGEDGYQVDALGEVFRDNTVTGKREFFGNYKAFKPSKPKRIGDTPKSNPIDKEAAFIEGETQEWDGEQPSATTQMELSNYTSLAGDVSAQPTSAGTNKTSTRDKLNIGPARMGRIEREK